MGLALDRGVRFGHAVPVDTLQGAVAWIGIIRAVAIYDASGTGGVCSGLGSGDTVAVLAEVGARADLTVVARDTIVVLELAPLLGVTDGSHAERIFHAVIDAEGWVRIVLEGGLLLIAHVQGAVDTVVCGRQTVDASLSQLTNGCAGTEQSIIALVVLR